MMSSLNELRGTFDAAAEIYDDARPKYPAELYSDLIDLSGITPGVGMLEMGCGSGKATRPLAERGFRSYVSSSVKGLPIWPEGI